MAGELKMISGEYYWEVKVYAPLYKHPTLENAKHSILKMLNGCYEADETVYPVKGKGRKILTMEEINGLDPRITPRI